MREASLLEIARQEYSGGPREQSLLGRQVFPGIRGLNPQVSIRGSILIAPGIRSDLSNAVNLGSLAFYPIIAQGKVFAAIASIPDDNSLLYALDAASGQIIWGPKVIGVQGGYSQLAYDAGNLFVVNSTGLLQSLDPNTGAVHWTTEFPGLYVTSATLVASQGIVYVYESGGFARLIAVDERNGRLLWTNQIWEDFDGPPYFPTTACFSPTTHSALTSSIAGRGNFGGPM